MKFSKISAINNYGIKEIFESCGEELLNTTDTETLKNRTTSFKIINRDNLNNNCKIIEKENMATHKNECCYRIV